MAHIVIAGVMLAQPAGDQVGWLVVIVREDDLPVGGEYIGDAQQHEDAQQQQSSISDPYAVAPLPGFGLCSCLLASSCLLAGILEQLP